MHNATRILPLEHYTERPARKMRKQCEKCEKLRTASPPPLPALYHAMVHFEVKMTKARQREGWPALLHSCARARSSRRGGDGRRRRRKREPGPATSPAGGSPSRSDGRAGSLLRCRGWHPVHQPCASATEASHWCLARGHSKGVCRFLCCRAPLCARGATVRGGCQRALEKEMGERQVVEHGAMWSRPPRHCPAQKDC